MTVRGAVGFRSVSGRSNHHQSAVSPNGYFRAGVMGFGLRVQGYRTVGSIVFCSILLF